VFFSFTVSHKGSISRKRRLSSPKLQEFVVERLQDYWSPEQISGWLHRKRGKNVLAFVTIYRAIHRGYLPSTLRFCLRRHDWGYSPPSTEKRGRLQGYRSIHRRPPGAENRSRFGHWEADTIRGAQRKGCLATFVDRKSRYTLAWVMPDRKAQTLCTAMHSLFAPLPPSLRRSFTVDHGNEFFSFGHIEADLHTRLYFADPYCPRQRALNENTNGLLRQYFPKKFDFLSISQDDVLRVLASLNARPRKSLGFRSPAEVFPLHFI
jgi:IS30 family transposase